MAESAPKVKKLKQYEEILLSPDSPKKQKLKALKGIARLGDVFEGQENLTLAALRSVINPKQPREVYERALKAMLKLEARGREKETQLDFYEGLLITSGLEYNESVGREYSTGKPAYTKKARELALDGLARLGDVKTSFGSSEINGTMRILINNISPEDEIHMGMIELSLTLSPVNNANKEGFIEFYNDILSNSSYPLKARKLAIEGLAGLGEAESLKSASENKELESSLRDAARKALSSLLKKVPSKSTAASITPKRIPPRKKGRLVA